MHFLRKKINYLNKGTKLTLKNVSSFPCFQIIQFQRELHLRGAGIRIITLSKERI